MKRILMLSKCTVQQKKKVSTVFVFILESIHWSISEESDEKIVPNKLQKYTHLCPV